MCCNDMTTTMMLHSVFLLLRPCHCCYYMYICAASYTQRISTTALMSQKEKAFRSRIVAFLATMYMHLHISILACCLLIFSLKQFFDFFLHVLIRMKVFWYISLVSRYMTITSTLPFHSLSILPVIMFLEFLPFTNTSIISFRFVWPVWVWVKKARSGSFVDIYAPCATHLDKKTAQRWWWRCSYRNRHHLLSDTCEWGASTQIWWWWWWRLRRWCDMLVSSSNHVFLNYSTAIKLNQLIVHYQDSSSIPSS